MYVKLKEEFDSYVLDWEAPEKRYAFSFYLAEFLIYFRDYVDCLDLRPSEKTRYYKNCWAVGYILTHYSEKEDFSPLLIQKAETFVEEFKDIFSEKKADIKHYEATWKLLKEYVRGKEYLVNYHSTKYEDELTGIEEMELTSKKIVAYLEEVDTQVIGKSIVNNLRRMICNYMEYEDRENLQHYRDQIGDCIELAVKVIEELFEMKEIDEKNIGGLIKEMKEHWDFLVALLLGTEGLVGKKY